VNAPAGISRRAALQAGGLALAFTWVGGSKALAAISPRRQPADAAAALADGNPAFAPNAFVRIDADGGVRLVMPMVEMGQAIYTGSAMLLAEELGVELDQVRVEHSPPNEALYGMPLLGGQITGGSTSTRGTYGVLREAGAVARTLLVSAAAAQWKVDPASCTVARGVVSHAASSRQLGFGALAGAAAQLPMPEKVALKEPKDFKLIGQPLRRVDSPGKVNGSTQFGLDVRVPGMKVATVKACPTLGGVLASVDDKAARAIPGVVDVIRIKDAVAVVGEHFWAAKRGLDALTIQWTPGQNSALTTQQLRAALTDALAKDKAIVGKETGKRPEGTLVQATYDLPMLAHATMEPLNTTVHVRADQCEIWVGTQVPARCVSVAAKITGLAEDKVVLHNQYLGGGFGRQAGDRLCRAGRGLRQAGAVPAEGGVDARGRHSPRHRAPDVPRRHLGGGRRRRAGPLVRRPHRGRHRAGPLGPSLHGQGRHGRRPDRVRGRALLRPAEPQGRVGAARHARRASNVGWWRGVGPTHNLFVMESFIDELAQRARKDPVAYRRAMLKKNPRTLAVLDLAAEKIGWGKGALPAARGPRRGGGRPLRQPRVRHRSKSRSRRRARCACVARWSRWTVASR
jgi:isoquinoline 1-oxidoreductase beta subunit